VSGVLITAYERTLGRSHHMTRQAKLHLEDVQREQQDFANSAW